MFAALSQGRMLSTRQAVAESNQVGSFGMGGMGGMPVGLLGMTGSMAGMGSVPLAQRITSGFGPMHGQSGMGAMGRMSGMGAMGGMSGMGGMDLTVLGGGRMSGGSGAMAAGDFSRQQIGSRTARTPSGLELPTPRAGLQAHTSARISLPQPPASFLPDASGLAYAKPDQQ